jgi:predicted aspartyl protease
MRNAGSCYALLNALAISSVLFCSSNTEAQQTPAAQSCGLKRYASLDLRTESDGQVSVAGSLGQQPLYFVIDTGGKFSTITREIAVDTHSSGGLTANAGGYLNNINFDLYADVGSFFIGPIPGSDPWRFVVVPDNQVPHDVAGTLAPDFLRNYDVEFDFYGGKVNFFAPHPCPGKAAYWTQGASAAIPVDINDIGQIIVNAFLDGKPVSVALDTGSDHSLMGLENAQKIFGFDRNDPRLKILGLMPINGGSTTRFNSFPFQTLSFNGIAVVNPKIDIISQKHFMTEEMTIFGSKHENPDIVLGMNVLRQLHIYIAYDEKVVYLTGAEAK